MSDHGSSDKSPLIALTDVTVRYDYAKPILSDVSLDIYPNDFIAVTGPNGGGKTTLMRVMLKLLRPTSGRVTYYSPQGTPVKNLRIGYLPQKNNIDTRFPITAGEVVASGLLKGWFSRRSPESDRKLQQIYDLVGIADYAHRQIGTLSGGQLQRTLLGRALISDPDILMLDEPLSYVDKQFEHQIYSLVEQLSHTKTIILITHEMSIIAGMANRHVIVDHSIHECTGTHHFIPSDCN